MNNVTMDGLIAALIDGDQALALEETRNLLDAGAGRGRIIAEGVETAMGQLDAKCTVEQFNLLEIMLCGRAAMGVIRELYPPGDPPPSTKGTVVIATLEGDVHDLGKNIVRTVLTATGYRVVDCGRNCPVERLVQSAAQEAAMAVGVSGLITTVIPRVRQVREAMAERGLGHVRLIAGGAALKQSSAEGLNVDFVAETAFDGLHYLGAVIGGAG